MRLASQRTLPAQHSYDRLLSFDLAGQPFQSDWLGVSANFMLFAAFPELALSGPQQTAEWDRVALSGVKMVRTWCGQDWAYATYPSGSPDWASTKMTAFYAGLQAMKDRGINVIVTLGWHFPGDICGISTPLGPACTPSGANETTWASWVSEFLNQTINVRGFDNIVGVFFFAEASTSGTGTVPGGYTALEYYQHVVTVARDKIVADDAGRTPIRSRIKICGSQEAAQTSAPWLPTLQASGVFDVLTAHSYCRSPTFGPLSLTANECPDDYAQRLLIGGYDTAAAPTPYWVDEVNTLVGGDTDSVGYRSTADAGLQLCRWIDSDMNSGAQAVFLWTLVDHHWVGSVPYEQSFGVCKYIGDGPDVRPSWYAFSMLANLTGGGGGTRLYRCTGQSSLIHGTGVSIPGGDYSFVVFNEGDAADIAVDFGGVDLGGRTIYRYSYTGELPPTDAVDPAYLLPWDRSIAGVTTSIPATRHPGHSVVVYSTLNVTAPVSVNLALQATASASATGYGVVANLVTGNFTNVLSARNSWRKLTDAAEPVEVTWGAAVSFARIELAFVGTTAGVVWADYATTAAPDPLADYTLEYWNGSTWVEIADVTGNTDPNATHTFAAVATTKLRLTANSAAATAHVNQIGVYAA